MGEEREVERNRAVRESAGEHLELYLATNGEEGFHLRGAPVLILTTIGRRTGAERPTPLMFGEDGENFVVVASLAGATDHPYWYLNLEAHPEAQVQVKAARYAVRARTAEGAERQRLWQLMTGVYSTYEEYQQRTERQIPVVVLERVADLV